MRTTAQDSLRFDGPSITPEDVPRLSRQLDRCRDLMLDARYRTLREIALHIGSSESGASARLRDLRKKRFGGYTVNRRRVPGTLGLWEYQVVPGVRS